MDHVVQLSDLAVWVGDDREVELGSADFTDIWGPTAVILDWIH
jgi:hypothetical protein